MANFANSLSTFVLSYKGIEHKVFIWNPHMESIVTVMESTQYKGYITVVSVPRKYDIKRIINLPSDWAISAGKHYIIIDDIMESTTKVMESTTERGKMLFNIFQKYVKKFEPLIEEEDIEKIDQIMGAFQ